MKEGLLAEFSRIQNRLRPLIKLEDSFQLEAIRLVAGVDLAYWEAGEGTYAVCCIAVVDYGTRKVVEKVYGQGEIKIPYLAGYLAFRELPLIMDTAKKLDSNPDIYILDGNGYLHERHMGIATHAAISLEKPSIGVAKSPLLQGNLRYARPENREGAYTDIFSGSEICGRVLRSRKNVRPIYISCGNWITLDTATEIVMSLVDEESRLPIPARMADLCSRPP